MWLLHLFLQRKHNLLEGERHWSIRTKITWSLSPDAKGSWNVSFCPRISIKHPSLHSCRGDIWRWISYGRFAVPIPNSDEQGMSAAILFFLVFDNMTFAWSAYCVFSICRRNWPRLKNCDRSANMLLKWQLWITSFQWKVMYLFHHIPGTWRGLLPVIGVSMATGKQSVLTGETTTSICKKLLRHSSLLCLIMFSLYSGKH